MQNIRFFLCCATYILRTIATFQLIQTVILEQQLVKKTIASLFDIIKAGTTSDYRFDKCS